MDLVGHHPADVEDLLRELRFRAAVDEEFRQALIAGEFAEIAVTYGLDPALFDGVRFVETPTGRAGERLLPRRVEEGAALTRAELQALVPGGTGAAFVADVCWLTCGMTSSTPPSPTPPSPPPSEPGEPPPGGGGGGICWMSYSAT